MEWITLGACVLGFYFDRQTVTCLCGNDLVRVENGCVTQRKQVFEKNGFARILGEWGDRIVISDFCVLYAFDKQTFELLNSVKLGKDLSSDICGMYVCDGFAYCAIRNGSVSKVDVQTFAHMEYTLSDAAFWEITSVGDVLYCGTVDGHILKVDKKTMDILSDAPIAKQNVKSILISGGTLYAACQDKKLYVLDAETLSVRQIKRNVHQKMFYIAGLCESTLVTVSYPACEFAMWDAQTLDCVRVIPERLRLSGVTRLNDGVLYYASRNIDGIRCLSLKG